MTGTNGEQPVCAWCGEPVTRKGARGPFPTYCRRSCRQRAYEARLAGELSSRPARAVAPAKARMASAGRGRTGMESRTAGPTPSDEPPWGVAESPFGTEAEVIRGLRHQLEMAVDRLRDASRMAAMLGRTSSGFEPDPRVEVLGAAIEATVEHLTTLCSDQEN